MWRASSSKLCTCSFWESFNNDLSSSVKSFPIYTQPPRTNHYMLIACQILIVRFPLVQKGIHELRFRIHRLLELLPTIKSQDNIPLHKQVSQNAHLEGELLLVNAENSPVEREELPLFIRQWHYLWSRSCCCVIFNLDISHTSGSLSARVAQLVRASC